MKVVAMSFFQYQGNFGPANASYFPYTLPNYQQGNLFSSNRMIGTNGEDHFTGGWLNDYLFGYDGNDTLIGNSGNDYLHGGSGNDSLEGGNGNDTMVGGGDSDTMQGGAGDDLFFARDRADRMEGGDGDDTFRLMQSATSQFHTAIGDDGEDTFYVANGARGFLFGGDDDDTFDLRGITIANGGDGSDYFEIREDGTHDSFHILNGGADQDQFMIYAQSNDDISIQINDYETGEKITVDHILDEFWPFDSNDDGYLTASDRGVTIQNGNLIVDVYGDVEITLLNRTYIDADDFIII
ncbi:MAG: calcium-binding protein [Pseudomonadota bacterium]